MKTQACYSDLRCRSGAVGIGADRLAHRYEVGCASSEMLPDQLFDALSMPKRLEGLHGTAFGHGGF